MSFMPPGDTLPSKPASNKTQVAPGTPLDIADNPMQPSSRDRWDLKGFSDQPMQEDQELAVCRTNWVLWDTPCWGQRSIDSHVTRMQYGNPVEEVPLNSLALL